MLARGHARPAIGWGTTAVVRLVFGSPLGLPSAEDVRLLLEELGIRASGVHPAARQVWGVAKYQATETCPGDSPGRIGIEVYGRDAADARLLTKAGRFVLYRDSGPELTITRLQQVEHEAYLTLRAGQAGVAVPEVLEAGTAGPSRDALLVSRLPAGTALADADPAQVSDAQLAPDAVPGPVQERGERPQAVLARGDRDDPAADPALARHPDVEQPVAGGLVQPGGRHDGQRVPTAR